MSDFSIKSVKTSMAWHDIMLEEIDQVENDVTQKTNDSIYGVYWRK